MCTYISPVATSTTIEWLPRYNLGHRLKYQLRNCKVQNNSIQEVSRKGGGE